jgi:hypothetical protein
MLPLRWGAYRQRFVVAAALVVAGGLLVQASSAYAELLLATGVAAHVVGWWILPGRGWPRLWSSILGALVMVLLLTGSGASAALLVPLAGWLFVRQRPAVAYLVLLLPLAAGIVLGQLFPQYGSGAIVTGCSAVVVIGAAWIARALAKRRQIPSQSRP